MDGLLPHLAATLRQSRLDAGLSLRDMESYGRERSNLRKVETMQAEPDKKYWPNLDEYVAAYSAATGVPQLALWADAIRRAMADETRSRRGANRQVLDRATQIAGGLLAELDGLSEVGSESHQTVSPKSRR